ncbi:MAG: EVE domain-containing protein [Verrucomicrobiales bacterium]|nr:EVE domain-containing protein [Verrucomicrobiales bacterium]
MQYWLVKQEPEDYAWSALVKDGRTAWTGIRNYQARNHLRAMREGDGVAYYHSGDAREVVGVARVVRAAYADPTAAVGDGDWSAVDLAAVDALPKPVTLAQIKADAVLQGMALVRQSRLSVVPVTAPQFVRLMQLGGGRMPGR